MTDVFEAHRARLLAVAYGMLGSVAEAEDVVQDAWLRWQAAAPEDLRSAEAFLVTVVTRLAIDRLRSARARRETYVGPWLPEPVVEGASPEDLVAEAEQLSLAVLATLERLNPVERAVLLLRDVFDFEYSEIADVVRRMPATCRQIARRAREHAGQPVRRARPTPEQEQRLLEAFAAAIYGDSLEDLTRTLAHDAVLWTDGGGRVAAARKPLVGGARIARALLALQRKSPAGSTVAPARVNGEIGLLLREPDGTLTVMAFEIADEAILGLRMVRNPEKLRHLEDYAAR
jgi:RNA polymerase sigma-70 factor (ECF subfamily)